MREITFINEDNRILSRELDIYIKRKNISGKIRCSIVSHDGYGKAHIGKPFVHSIGLTVDIEGFNGKTNLTKEEFMFIAEECWNRMRSKKNITKYLERLKQIKGESNESNL